MFKKNFSVEVFTFCLNLELVYLTSFTMKKLIYTIIAMLGLLFQANAQCTSPTLSLSLPDTTIAFKKDSIQLDGGAGFTSYAWNTGETSQTIWVKGTKKVNLTVTNSLGACGRDTTSIFFINGIEQVDTSICKGSSIKINIKNSFPESGLVSWYPFNGNTKNVTSNLYLGNNFGASFTTDKFGFENSACSFNGISNRILTNPYSTNNWTSYTISFWMKQQSSVNGQPIDFRSFDQNSIYFIINSGKISAANFISGLGSSIFINSAPTISDSKWHHIALTKLANTTYFYIDGIVAGTSNNFNYFNLNGFQNPNLNIGSRYNSSGYSNYYTGLIDDVGVWNRYLNADEIKSLYNGTGNKPKYTWSTNDTGNVITVTPLVNTTYKCIQKLGSYILIDSIRIAINNLPNFNTLQDSTIVFKQDSFILNAGNSYINYNWNRGDTSSQIKIKQNGQYKVTVTDNFGCKNSDSTTVLFIKGILNKDSIVCKNSTVIMLALNQINGNYLWSTGQAWYSIQIKVNSDTIIKCKYQFANYILEDSVKFTIRPLPSNQLIYDKNGFCAGDTIKVYAINGCKYEWIEDLFGQSSTQNPLLIYKTGRYKLYITDSNGCSNETPGRINFFIAPSPKANIISLNSSSCLNGNVFKFTDSTQIDSGTYTRNWDFGNGIYSSDFNPQQTYSNVGTYQVKLNVKTNYGCIDSVIKSVTVKPNPIAGTMLGQTNGLTTSTPYIYTVAQQANHTYNWMVTNGIVALGQSTNAATIQWINNGVGYVKVEVTNPQGCSDTTSLNVGIGNQPNIISFVPTSAKTGETVIISGVNLTGATAVKFGGVNAQSFNVISSNQISAIVGTGATGDVTVITPSGTATLIGFTYLTNSGLESVNLLNGLKIYPNPAKNELIISTNQKLSGAHIIITDMLGRKMLEENIINASNNHNILVSELKTGAYILSIFDSDNKLISNNKIAIIK